MSDPATDFPGIIRMLAANHRTGTLQVTGEGFAADVDFVSGRIARVEPRAGGAWPLGEILRELHLVAPDLLEKAARTAVRKGREPEAVLVERGWVTASVIKRYRERLSMALLVDLAVQTGFRAELHPRSNEKSASQPWDIEIPVPYALKEIARRTGAMRNLSVPLPAPDARFEKVPEAIAVVLGKSGTEIQGGNAAPSVLTPTEKRVFFFCNGRVQFRNIPVITGLTPEQTAVILHKLSGLGAIRPAEKKRGSDLLGSGTRRTARAFFGFAGGVAAVGMLALVGLQSVTWLQHREAFPPRPTEQSYFTEAQSGAFHEIQGALFAYFVNENLYPRNLQELTEGGYLSFEALAPPRAARDLTYTPVEGGLAYRLAQYVGRDAKKAGSKVDKKKKGDKKGAKGPKTPAPSKQPDTGARGAAPPAPAEAPPSGDAPAAAAPDAAAAPAPTETPPAETGKSPAAAPPPAAPPAAPGGASGKAAE